MATTTTNDHAVRVDKLERQLAMLEEIENEIHHQKSLTEQGLRGLHEWWLYAASLQQAKLKTFQDTGSEAWLQEMDQAFMRFRKYITILRTAFVDNRETLVELLFSDGGSKEWRHSLRDALTKLQHQRGAALPQVLEDEVCALEHSGMRTDLSAMSRDYSQASLELKQSVEMANTCLVIARATLERTLRGSKKFTIYLAGFDR